jgi:hypothetical protein
MTDQKHCDDYADAPSGDPSARWFIFINRLPVGLKQLVRERGIPSPRLFADHAGTRVRVVMASRLGDLGITTNLGAEHGYEWRVSVEDLTNFSETP